MRPDWEGCCHGASNDDPVTQENTAGGSKVLCNPAEAIRRDGTVRSLGGAAPRPLWARPRCTADPEGLKQRTDSHPQMNPEALVDRSLLLRSI